MAYGRERPRRGRDPALRLWFILRRCHLGNVCRPAAPSAAGEIARPTNRRKRRNKNAPFRLRQRGLRERLRFSAGRRGRMYAARSGVAADARSWFGRGAPEPMGVGRGLDPAVFPCGAGIMGAATPSRGIVGRAISPAAGVLPRTGTFRVTKTPPGGIHAAPTTVIIVHHKPGMAYGRERPRRGRDPALRLWFILRRCHLGNVCRPAAPSAAGEIARPTNRRKRRNKNAPLRLRQRGLREMMRFSAGRRGRMYAARSGLAAGTRSRFCRPSPVLPPVPVFPPVPGFAAVPGPTANRSLSLCSVLFYRFISLPARNTRTGTGNSAPPRPGIPRPRPAGPCPRGC